MDLSSRTKHQRSHYALEVLNDSSLSMSVYLAELFSATVMREVHAENFVKRHRSLFDDNSVTRSGYSYFDHTGMSDPKIEKFTE